MWKALRQEVADIFKILFHNHNFKMQNGYRPIIKSPRPHH